LNREDNFRIDVAGATDNKPLYDLHLLPVQIIH